MKLPRYALLAAAVSLVTACGAKLLWEARFTEFAPKVVSSLAVDAQNNVYVGSGIRQSESSMAAPAHESLLLKYNAEGQLQWSSHVSPLGAVRAVEPLSESLLAVMTSEFFSYTEQPAGHPGELWLVSAETGAPISRIATFGTEAGNDNFHKMKAINGYLYVAKGTLQQECEIIAPCDTEQLQSRVDVFDATGALVNQRKIDNADIVDFDVSDNATLALLLRGPQTEVEYWSGDLQTTWNSSSSMATSLALAECQPERLKLDNENAHILCQDRVLKFSSSGSIAFSTSFETLLKTTTAPSGDLLTADWWVRNASVLDVDSSGNILLAKTRAKVFLPNSEVPVHIGGVELGEVSTLSADVITVKLDGNSGTILWSEDINTPVSGAADHFSSSYYYPLGLHLSGDNVLVSFRGQVASYNFCGDIADWESFEVNTCNLASFNERYGKTVAYRSVDGKRLASKRHEIAFPRKVVVDNTGQLIVAGDMESSIFWHLLEAIPYGVEIIWDDGGIFAPAETSDVIVQKYKF